MSCAYLHLPRPQPVPQNLRRRRGQDAFDDPPCVDWECFRVSQGVVVGLRFLKSSQTAIHYGASDIVFDVQTPVEGRPAAPDQESVRRFHEIALANGGRDESAPGIRQNYNAKRPRRLLIARGNIFAATTFGPNIRR